MVKRFKFFQGKDNSFEELMDSLHQLDELVTRVVGINEIVGRDVRPPWRTARGQIIELTELTLTHIEHIIDCLNDRGSMRIPDIYEGFTKQEWIEIMMNELERRNNERL